MNSRLHLGSVWLKELFFWAVSISLEILCVLGILYSGCLATLFMLITLAGLGDRHVDLLALFPFQYILMATGFIFVLCVVFRYQRNHVKKRRCR